MVGFDDFAADGETQAEADVTSSEKGRGGFFGGLGGEASAVVLHFDLEATTTVHAGFRLEFASHLWVGGIGLQSVEHHLSKSMLQSGAVASNYDRNTAGLVF